MPGRTRRVAHSRELLLVLTALLTFTAHCAPLSSAPRDQLADYSRSAQRFPISSTSPFAPYRKRIALLVGVDEYQRDDLASLKYAVKDAEDIGRMLEANYGFEVQVLRNSEATKEGLINAIIRLRDQTSFDDQLLFFFAGHGVSFGTKEQETGYVLPSGALGRTQNLAWLSGLSMNELVGHLTKLPPKHILILLDSCFGGYAAIRPRSVPDVEPRRILERLTSQPARHLITAGKRGEEVWESDAWGHSAFGLVLLRALGSGEADRKRDGLVPVSELFSFLETEVPELTDGRQTPQFAALDDSQGSFVFIRKRRRTPPNHATQRMFPLAVTPANTQKKAIISRYDAKLFDASSGVNGRAVALNQVFFMLEAELEDRLPVTYGPNKANPDGWLERRSFVEWNTILMVDPERSSGPEPTPIFPDLQCAERYALTGRHGPCQELRTFGQGPPVPVLEQTAHAYRAGFVLISAVSGTPELVLGWMPRSSKQKATATELLFLPKSTASTLANLMETVALAAQEAVSGENDIFLLNLAPSLAILLRIRPDEVLRPGESLESLITKAERLPFLMPLFSFTVEQVDGWSSADFANLSRVLNEKATALREFTKDSTNTHMFGETPHAFVPRELLP